MNGQMKRYIEKDLEGYGAQEFLSPGIWGVLPS